MHCLTNYARLLLFAIATIFFVASVCRPSVVCHIRAPYFNRSTII